MKKVALLAYDGARLHLLRGVAALLMRKGVEVQAFTHYNCESKAFPIFNEPWGSFKFTRLRAFAPEKIVMFNGFSPLLAPASHFLRTLYPVFHLEFGWLPQRRNAYLDHGGMNARGYWAQQGVNVIAENFCEKSQKEMEKLYVPVEVSAMPPSLVDSGTVKPYYVVPLQLETDTTIIYDSPFIKTMEGLIKTAHALVKKTGAILAVKTHPKNKDNSKIEALCATLENTLVFGSDVRMIDLAAYSKGVIAINSTASIEAVVHKKVPVYTLGTNVLFNNIEDARQNFSPKRFLKGPYAPHNLQDRLNALFRIQFDMIDCPDWVYDYMVSETAHGLQI